MRPAPIVIQNNFQINQGFFSFMMMVIFQIKIANSQKVKIQNIVSIKSSVYLGILYQFLKMSIFTSSLKSINKNAILLEKYCLLLIQFCSKGIFFFIENLL